MNTYTTTVSIITVTQLDRHECVCMLYEFIQWQTYPHIVEWVIVEGSPSEEKSKQNQSKIQHLIDRHTGSFKIVYLPFSNQKLSDLRNLGNESCQGDIIVCMDDDDYYPQERVQHAVEELENSSCLIAGCTDLYMYEYRLQKMYKFYGFHPNHSTNNVMAFKRSYLCNHRHDGGLSMGEEKSFTKNYTEPMVQLQASKSVIVSSHSRNTFDKLDICTYGTQGRFPSLEEVNENQCLWICPNKFAKMKQMFQLKGTY